MGSGVVGSCRHMKGCSALVFRTKKIKLVGLPKRRELLWQSTQRVIAEGFDFCLCHVDFDPGDHPVIVREFPLGGCP